MTCLDHSMIGVLDRRLTLVVSAIAQILGFVSLFLEGNSSMRPTSVSTQIHGSLFGMDQGNIVDH